MLRLAYRPAPDWPPLAWLARLPARGAPDDSTVLVTHGSRVETRDDWFGEIVWDGDFGKADFDTTEVVFGSGARVRREGSELLFVTAASTVDRIHSIESGGHLWVSNSLACLLQQVGGAPDPIDRTWFDRMGSCLKGIRDYDRHIPTSAGPVRLTYHYNLAWREGTLEEIPKPDAVNGFPGYHDYIDFLRQAIGRLAPNAADARRAFPVPLLGTISGGFDSPMVAALAREAADLREAFCFRRPDGSDSGEEIARVLGLDVTYFGREDWREDPNMPEVPFIAADAKGEDVFTHGAAGLVRGRTMLSGHYGGIILNRNWSYPNDQIERHDRSGTALLEWRLITGCIHASIFFLGARHGPDVLRISTSPEMQSWSLGGWYDRPIPRRLLEEAGVPRQAFGITKRAGSILFIRPGINMTPAASRDFTGWLRQHRGAFLRSGRIPPTLKRPVDPVVGHAATLSAASLLWARGQLPRHRGGKLERLAARLRERGRRDPLFDYAFPWAIERLKRRYPPVPEASAA